ncbi:hypothetical protein CCR75_004907 [Bremia lactucae]|uniref:Uncharacterized protein n=1 Tax=Bremia lactucae TaxID=4779 RepID=A0A976FG91_BRELC|nr:hypothetical protein CCR75_004907 [Bremia lactucae]
MESQRLHQSAERNERHFAALEQTPKELWSHRNAITEYQMVLEDNHYVLDRSYGGTRQAAAVCELLYGTEAPVADSTKYMEVVKRLTSVNGSLFGDCYVRYAIRPSGSNEIEYFTRARMLR